MEGGCNDSSEFFVGEQFTSYDLLESKISSFSKTTFTQLWKRDARKISAVKSVLVKKLEPSLKYYELKYACIFGGRKFKQKSTATGQRETSTFRQDCPVHIAIRASSDGKSLEVKSVCLNHNHAVSKESYAHLPHQRKLKDTDLEKAKNLLDLQANKKLVQQVLQESTQQVITLKDLSNIASSTPQSKDNLTSTVELLRDKYNAEVHILKDDENNFQGLFFQTQSMKTTMDAFPEFLAMDGTYKLLRLNFPVYLLMVEDGNCQSEIVGVGILVLENTASVQWFVQTFKDANPSTSKTRCIMTDKDLTERQVLKENFPNSSIILCIFHTLRTLSREISTEKLGISQNKRLVALEFLQKMVYAKSNEEFDKLYQDFEKVVPKSVIDYYKKNWHNSRAEWSLGKEFHTANFLNTPNNRLESINGKLKSVIKKHSTLEDFIHKFFVILYAMENERNHKAVVGIQKRPTNYYKEGSLKDKYFKLLTRGAAKYVIKELELSKSVKNITEMENNVYTQLSPSEGCLEVSIHTCTCNFIASMLLPCRHIFAVRKLRGISGFDANLCDDRWKQNYYNQHQRLLRSNTGTNENEQPDLNKLSCTTYRKKRPKSVAAKRNEALVVANTLADLASLNSDIMFERRMYDLKLVQTYWETGFEVTIGRQSSTEKDNNIALPVLNQNFTDLEISVTDETGRVSDTNFIDEIEGGFNINDNTLQGSKINVFNNNKSPIQSFNLENNEPILIAIPYDKMSTPVKTIENADDIILPINDETDILNNNNSPIKRHNFKKNELLENEVASVSRKDTKSCATALNQKENTILSDQLQTIKMPAVSKRRGRPKGHGQTTIGLPKKKSHPQNGSKPTTFIKLPFSEKQMKVLKMITMDETVIKKAFDNNLIEINDIQIQVDKISNTILDQCIDINIVRQYFTDDAWRAIESLIEKKNKTVMWLCNSCNNSLQDASIGCDSCLKWYHLKCAGLLREPKARVWFCRHCYKS